MADIYTPPPDSAYLLLTPFDMPTESGSVRAVAFSGNSGTFVTAALSVALTVIFICLWNLICFLFIVSSRETSRRRYVALVTLCNSHDSWFAFKGMASYTWHYFNSKCRADFWYGLGITVLAFCVYGGSLALGIVGPSLVHIGSVAPVRASVVFYPATPNPTAYADQLEVFGMRAPGVLRALGSVEAAKVTMRSRVSVDYDRNVGEWENGEPIHRLTYNYRVGGVELGLQQGADLELAVRGACVTEYGWYPDNQTESTDRYSLWGDNVGFRYDVPIDRYNIQHAPKAAFLSHPEAAAQYARGGNSSFAVIVWSAHRASISNGDDPWYATESRNSSMPAPFDAQFWIKRARPVLSCWEHDTWSWAGQAVRNVTELQNIAGIKVAKSLLRVLEAAFTTPVVVRIGNASGDSALRSRTTSPNGVIDAGASSIHDDMERLLVASFVASRNVFVDAIMFEHDGTYQNIVEDSTGQPAAGAGDFVVSSPDIQTFSLGGIIAIVVILIALLLIESVISYIISSNRRPNKSSNEAQRGNGATKTGIDNKEANTNVNEAPGSKDDKKTINTNKAAEGLIRFKVLMATQLFRRIYEPESGGKKHESWACDDRFPEENDESHFKLAE
ncbi:hypothetical protein MMYC01_209622, partial [Madurella mycetomatis]